MAFVDLKLAVRNTYRHRTRTAIAISAIGFGVMALLLAGGFVEWIFWATAEAAIQTGLGHIRVVRPGYQERGVSNPFPYLLPETSPELSALTGAPHVTGVTPRLNFSGLVSHGETTLAFIGEGVNPDNEHLVNRYLEIAEGENLSGLDPKGFILGRGLAASLGVRPGDNVVLLATTASGGMNAVEGHVRGLFSTGAKAFDDVALRVPIESSRTLLSVAGAHIWVVSLDRTEQTPESVAELRARFAETGLQFIPWFDLADYYTKTVALLTSQMDVVRLIIGLIIVLSISNTLIMNVLERTSEIGTLMAMGTRRREILTLFLSEGLLLGIAGGALGLAAGVALAEIISAVGIPMPPPPGRSSAYSAAILVTWRLAAGAFAIAIATTVAASIYPAWKASRLAIVDALRHSR